MHSPWLDTQRLATWLSARVAGGASVAIPVVRRVLGGLSAETYYVVARWESDGAASDHELILRRDPPVGLRRLTGGVVCEYRVMSALAGSPVPVPPVYGLERDPSWLERPFVVERFLPGTTDRNLFNSPGYAAVRPVLGERFIEILAALHRLPVADGTWSFFEHPGTGTCPAAREVERWENLLARTRQEPDPLLVEAFLWLKRNLPVAPRVSVVHGEYRPGNFLYEGPEIIAILDWEYGHLGDPVEDLGWAFLRQFRIRDLESGLFRREEFLARYESQVGFAVDREAARFWEVFANVKVLVMLSDGQDAFVHGLMDAPLVSSVPGSNLQAEVVRLIGL